ERRGQRPAVNRRICHRGRGLGLGLAGGGHRGLGAREHRGRRGHGSQARLHLGPQPLPPRGKRLPHPPPPRRARDTHASVGAPGPWRRWWPVRVTIPSCTAWTSSPALPGTEPAILPPPLPWPIAWPVPSPISTRAPPAKL